MGHLRKVLRLSGNLYKYGLLAARNEHYPELSVRIYDFNDNNFVPSKSAQNRNRIGIVRKDSVYIDSEAHRVELEDLAKYVQIWLNTFQDTITLRKWINQYGY